MAQQTGGNMHPTVKVLLIVTGIVFGILALIVLVLGLLISKYSNPTVPPPAGKKRTFVGWTKDLSATMHDMPPALRNAIATFIASIVVCLILKLLHFPVGSWLMTMTFWAWLVAVHVTFIVAGIMEKTTIVWNAGYTFACIVLALMGIVFLGDWYFDPFDRYTNSKIEVAANNPAATTPPAPVPSSDQVKVEELRLEQLKEQRKIEEAKASATQPQRSRFVKGKPSPVVTRKEDRIEGGIVEAPGQHSTEWSREVLHNCPRNVANGEFWFYWDPIDLPSGARIMQMPDGNEDDVVIFPCVKPGDKTTFKTIPQVVTFKVTGSDQPVKIHYYWGRPPTDKTASR